MIVIFMSQENKKREAENGLRVGKTNTHNETGRN